MKEPTINAEMTFTVAILCRVAASLPILSRPLSPDVPALILIMFLSYPLMIFMAQAAGTVQLVY